MSVYVCTSLQLTRDTGVQLFPVFIFLILLFLFLSSALLQPPGPLLYHLVRLIGAGPRGGLHLHVVHLPLHPVHADCSSLQVFEHHAVLSSQTVHGLRVLEKNFLGHFSSRRARRSLGARRTWGTRRARLIIHSGATSVLICPMSLDKCKQHMNISMSTLSSMHGWTGPTLGPSHLGRQGSPRPCEMRGSWLPACIPVAMHPPPCSPPLHFTETDCLEDLSPKS
ncbi:hypothetical protein EYF80_039035 [Liparis tanakae]|uniref:Uncharacterized protein n=1 Tax=Liparis tanakae TaxID=230148 RepID=A0A4Z2GBZ4_9TELE|nr:hypothetical protein EYF80_039035 [Liparis tanakae]